MHGLELANPVSKHALGDIIMYIITVSVLYRGIRRAKVGNGLLDLATAATALTGVQLYNGERRPKTDATFDALGNSDELNASIGLAREHCSRSNNGLQLMLEEIQSRLFDIGAAIATPLQNSSDEKKSYVKFSPVHTQQLEEWIDGVDASLPPLKNFVIPSGGLSSLHLNMARTICRRCERSVVPLVQSEQVDTEVGVYLNRLSDLLFALTRAAAHRENIPEIIWKKAKDN